MNSTKLSEDQKEYLWEEINRYSNTLEEPVSEYIRKIVYERCIPREFKVFLDNPECKKICIHTDIGEGLNLKDIGLGETIYKPDENCRGIRISYIYLRILDFPQYTENIDIVKEFLGVCTEDELDTLRNLVMNYVKFEYKMLNRFNKYLSYPELAHGDRGFLKDVNTWEELRGINEDWYNIVCEKFKKDDSMIMTGMALEDKIKNLRNIIDL